MDPIFNFDNTYAEELEGMYVPWQPATVPSPAVLRFNQDLAIEMGLSIDGLNGSRGRAIFSGNEVPVGAVPLAQAYAGHQFGRFSSWLGDGRALLLGEVIDRQGRRRDIVLKGSGPTPFSRGGDGKAAVGPVLREYLIGEAMHAVGIPTTRALAAVRTGETIVRDQPLPGAVLTRVAASHLRVGSFEFFAARGDQDRVRRLMDYAIRRHDPELMGNSDRYVKWFEAIVARQAKLIAQWMHVGFIHGVMNTDNMTISGETIDYGPCAFIEAYNPQAVFSSIDSQGRYAYANQPRIARWNLERLGEAILAVVVEQNPGRGKLQINHALDTFVTSYDTHWLAGVRAKLGLTTSEYGDFDLAKDWLALLEVQKVDFTLAWRRLADAAEDNVHGCEALFHEPIAFHAWLARWRERCTRESIDMHVRSAAMRQKNPLYIPRNHRVEQALAAATDNGDLGPFNELLEVLARPFDERPGLESYADPAPAETTACYKTFCGT